MKTITLIALYMSLNANTWANCTYEGKEFPERATLKMISSIKECQAGRWEKIHVNKNEEVCPLADTNYPVNTIVKTPSDYKICKLKKTGFEWETAQLNDATPQKQTK